MSSQSSRHKGKPTEPAHYGESLAGAQAERPAFSPPAAADSDLPLSSLPSSNASSMVATEAAAAPRPLRVTTPSSPPPLEGSDVGRDPTLRVRFHDDCAAADDNGDHANRVASLESSMAKPSASLNPMAMLYQSFVNPVSDEQALASAAKMTLGQATDAEPTRVKSTTAPSSPTENMHSVASGTILPTTTGDTYVYRYNIRTSSPPEMPPLETLLQPLTTSFAPADAPVVQPTQLPQPLPELIERQHSKTSEEKPLISSTEPPPPADAPAATSSSFDEPARALEVPGQKTFITTGSFLAPPILPEDIEREKIIVECFNSLSTETRRVELLEAFYVAHLQPYEHNSSFTADNWDDMTHKKVTKRFEMSFDRDRGCFYVTVFHQRYRVFLFSFIFRSLAIFLFWVVMFCLLPKNWFWPGGLYFDTITTILFAGIVGTLGARVLTVPAIVGVIWAGILWNNAPYPGRLTKGITPDMRRFVSTFGLSIGLLRAGLSISVIRFKQKLKHYITFSMVPMAMEMTVHGLCCKAIYHFPNYKWAMAEGFLVSSIAPSVVVPIIITYQRKGYGVRDGPSMMMLCSIAFDTAVCVWGVQFLLALEFKSMSTALLIVLAPVQILIGLVGGVILGTLVFVVTFYILFMEGERLPGIRNNRQLTLRHSVHIRYISIGFMVLVCFTCLAVGNRFYCLGGGAIGVVMTAGTFNYLCVRGGTPDHLRVKADMMQTLTTVWDYVAMPSLFGLSGAAVNVHELFARDFIGQAFALVFIGIGTRALFAMICPLVTRLGLSWSEILFCGIGWIGKGSVQGSLGSTALQYAQAELSRAVTPEEVAIAKEHIALGIKMKNTAILSILVACPLCCIFLVRFTGKMLRPNT